jgi:hypothetical protein
MNKDENNFFLDFIKDQFYSIQLTSRKVLVKQQKKIERFIHNFKPIDIHLLMIQNYFQL